MTAKILLLLAVFLPTSAWAQSAELLNQAKKEGGEVILDDDRWGLRAFQQSL